MSGLFAFTGASTDGRQNVIERALDWFVHLLGSAHAINSL
jgi:hypothetical protein